jgi:hypothetical protein
MPAVAQRIKVGVGQEVGAIDFALVPARTSRVSGTVFDAAGAPVANEPVTLSQEIMGPQGGATFPSSNTAQTVPRPRFARLIGCGLRLGELLRSRWSRFSQREEHSVYTE